MRRQTRLEYLVVVAPLALATTALLLTRGPAWQVLAPVGYALVLVGILAIFLDQGGRDERTTLDR